MTEIMANITPAELDKIIERTSGVVIDTEVRLFHAVCVELRILRQQTREKDAKIQRLEELNEAYRLTISDVY